ncbi:MAG TPA: sulfite dehydrogenase, partial [Sulfurovum sp.]|nr:sulfite dehydrogenase [Sulfurovum sp.]
MSTTIENRVASKSESFSTDSRRGFLRGMFVSAAAASVLAPIKLKADDAAILEEAEWGIKLGYPTNKHPYGIPSPYEHNNVRRVTEILSSGDMYASVAMSPLHEQEGI